MASLREIERAFMRAILFDETEEIARYVEGGGIDPARRVGIYRNNALETFAGTVAATFPVLERLAGREWLRQTAREYVQRYPSRSGNLHFAGAHLAAFLERRLSGTKYEYFIDVARLEWAYQEVLVAADRPPLEVERLAAVPPEDHGRIVFELVPAVRLVASRFPLLAIWRANREHEDQNSTDPTGIDLASGPSRILLIRRDDHVELRELPQDDYRFLDACRRSTTLAQAADALASPEALPEILTRAVGSGVLVDFTLET